MNTGHLGPETRPAARSWSDLGPRVASGLLLLGLSVAAIWLGGIVFSLVVAAIYAGAYREWEMMVRARRLDRTGTVLAGLVGLTAVSFYPAGVAGALLVLAAAAAFALAAGRRRRLWRAMGVVIAGLSVIALHGVRGDDGLGIVACVFLGTVVWGTDSAAFFTGRQVGGVKLSPDISPSKTWSGALGGLVLGTLLGTVVWAWGTPSPWWIGTLIAAVISVAGQAGDLGESGVKRIFRIKDSGDIIPGHGGLMDRIDSLTAGAVVALAVGLAHGGPGEVAAGLLLW